MRIAIQFTQGNRRARRITREQFDAAVAGTLPGFTLIRRVNSRMVFIEGDGPIPDGGTGPLPDIAPVLVSITPGSADVGTGPVTAVISGRNFLPTTQWSDGGVALTNVTYVSPIEASVVIPDSATPAQFNFTAENGTEASVATLTFEYELP
jgi:hypothetical protein